MTAVKGVQQVYKAGDIPEVLEDARRAGESRTAPIIVLQQVPEPRGSWLGLHKGDLLAVTGAGIVAVGLVMSIAIVALAVGIGAISCALGWVVLKTVMGDQQRR